MLESLRSNPIQARIAYGDLPEADPIIATTKGDQLQQIMKGLPKDTDKQSISKDKKQLDEATRSFGYAKCIAKDGKWLVEGMKTSLHAHQVIGTSWMLRREFSNDWPHGGLLADEMGMGKTLQTLACIVSNPASEDDRNTYCRATVIVAPASAIPQWEDETTKHTSSDYINAVLHYKQSKRLPKEALENMSVIFISYQEVCRQFPSKKLLARLQKECRSAEEFKEEYNKSLGMLFKIKFWRIVLDESHNIKNNDSQTSIACQNLNGRYRWALSGTPITNSVDVLFLRLRQGVTHPFLLESVMKNDLDEGDLQEIQHRLREVGGRLPVFERIGNWCAKEATAIISRKHHNGPKSTFGNSQFGYKFNIGKQLDLALRSKRINVCRICYQKPINTQTGKCGHLFCKECLMSHMRDEHREGRLITKCFECKEPLVDFEPLKPSDLRGSDSEGSISATASQNTIFRGRRLGRDSFKKHPKLNKSECMFLQECDQAHPEPVVPSAKTTAVKATILKWLSEAPDDKIIVFLEFKMTGAIIGRMLAAEGIPFLYFFGDMDTSAKQHAIRGFHEKSQIKVMIASIRCGSVALNLTIANRVIIVDLWWNLAIEMQAFARVFRIGQTKETYFRRIVADATIDNRMEALQEEKEENISKLMESGGKKKLSIQDALSLFGRVERHENGTFQVLSDDGEEPELDETEEVEMAGGI
ncbi:P-loop containing nucleoside triphosphate hydrolase protein [Xylaria sp. FL1777]|nr:P-loop containing nucleoside triphosphate hydrolase protein [Xylaria sp. FL1777]